MDHKLNIWLILGLIFITSACSRRECIPRKVANADTVCVCNATYCDDFPPLQRPKPGFAKLYESTKSGLRFKESEIEFVKQNSGSAAATSTVTITVDSDAKYQTINGFGGAFTDSTGQMLKSVNESLADLLLDSYFSDNGIEYSMARIPLAGTDFSDRPYSYDDVEGDLELKHFALQKEDTEWKIPYIKKALKASPHKIKLFGSPWAPPAWMKTNNKVSNSGELKGKVGGEYYQAFANYFVKFLDAYKAQGINFWGLTVENEPIEGWNPYYPFNCLNLTGDTEGAFVRENLGPALARAGYGTDKLKLMIFDENLNGGNFDGFVGTILRDKEAAKYVSGIAYHWYGNQAMKGFPDGFLTEVYKNYSQYFLLNTEACHLEGAASGRWDAGEKYAFDIIRALNNYVTGWVEWNMALDMNAGPRWNSKQGFGGTLNIDPTKGEAYKQPSFYAIGHFSKFVSPDSVRIGHIVDKLVDGLSVLTVRRPDNQTVLVALNANKEDIALNINHLNNRLAHIIPGNSLQSYIW